MGASEASEAPAGKEALELREEGGRLLSFTSSATNERAKYMSEARFMFYWELKTLFVIVMVFGY